LGSEAKVLQLAEVDLVEALGGRLFFRRFVHG
jgi:hypothetical protein